MAPRIKQTLSKAHKDAIRQAAVARHAARKAAGLPAPTGLPYITPPEPPSPDPVIAPKPVVVPEPVVASVEIPPYGKVSMPPRLAFTQWLRGREGVSASDPRMSTDAVRFGAELEDRLFVAWQAGYAAGKDTNAIAL
jgi:hypothetical protein